jgi:hypothetical protein
MAIRLQRVNTVVIQACGGLPRRGKIQKGKSTSYLPQGLPTRNARIDRAYKIAFGVTI